MINIQNSEHRPTLEEMSEYVRNPVFDKFCSEIKTKYNTDGQPEYSKCSWMPGWNIKFRKSGKSLCTIYPNENYFTVLVVSGKNEKEKTEEILPFCSPEIREIYFQTKESGGQKWLMIDIEDDGAVYNDVLMLIKIRGMNKRN